MLVLAFSFQQWKCFVCLTESAESYFSYSSRVKREKWSELEIAYNVLLTVVLVANGVPSSNDK